MGVELDPDARWKTHVERDIGDLVKADDVIGKRLDSMDRTLLEINKTLTDIDVWRRAEEKRSKFWEKIKSGALLLLIGIGLTQLGKLAQMVQAAKYP